MRLLLAVICFCSMSNMSFATEIQPKDKLITLKIAYDHGDIHAHWRFTDVKSGEQVSLRSNSDSPEKWSIFVTPTRLNDSNIKIVTKINENGELVSSPNITVLPNQPAEVKVGDIGTADLMSLKLEIQE